jgi:hypothetical protein
LGQIITDLKANHNKKWEAIVFGISKEKKKSEILQDHQFVNYSHLGWESLKLPPER